MRITASYVGRFVSPLLNEVPGHPYRMSRDFFMFPAVAAAVEASWASESREHDAPTLPRPRADPLSPARYRTA